MMSSESDPPEQKQRRSWIVPGLIGGIALGLIAWQEGTAHMARGFAVPIIVLLAVLSLALWWAAARHPSRKWRLLMVVLSAGALGWAAPQVLRYEGSADGTARPKLVWRWAASRESRSLSAEVPTARAGAPLVMPTGAAAWPRFMGADGDGRVPQVNWATDWAQQPPREVWRVEVGQGWSGFTVADGRAFTMEQRGEEECVSAYGLETGELLWLHRRPVRFDEPLGGQGPRATPTLDAARGCLYAQGATGLLHCLDMATGAVRWSRDVLADTDGRNLTYAKSNAPLLVGDRVIVSGGKGGATLIAYRAEDGEPVWQSGTDAASYASPVLRSLGGVDQVVSVNATSVTGHEPSSGALLWTFDWPGNLPKVGQPIPVGADQLLVTSGYGMKSHLIEIRRGAADAGKKAGFTAAARWTASTPRTKFSSASVVGDHLYGIDEGTLVCARLDNGERVWRSGRYGYGPHLHCGQDLLLIQSEPGAVVLVKAEPAGLKELARLEALSSKTWNPPALAGRWLLVRNDQEAVCYELPAVP